MMPNKKFLTNNTFMSFKNICLSVFCYQVSVLKFVSLTIDWKDKLVVVYKLLFIVLFLLLNYSQSF